MLWGLGCLFPFLTLAVNSHVRGGGLVELGSQHLPQHVSSLLGVAHRGLSPRLEGNPWALPKKREAGSGIAETCCLALCGNAEKTDRQTDRPVDLRSAEAWPLQKSFFFLLHTYLLYLYIYYFISIFPFYCHERHPV